MKTHFKHYTSIRALFPVLLLLLLYPATGFSLDNDSWNTGLNFRFYPPGARALGMGGAFVGLADDATAAASNPAGLAQLSRMQLAIEGRFISMDEKRRSFFTDGNLTRLTSNEDDITEVSFGAFTTPLFDNMFNISIFYDKPMSFSVKKLENINSGAFVKPSSNDISIHEAGVSVAKSFAGGKLMLGAGIGLQFFDMETRETAPTFTGRVDESETDLSYRVGILVKPIDNLRIGASYTMMPEFDTELKFLTPGIFNVDSVFDVPDNLSLGTAYNIFPNWVLIFEARYIFYTQLMEGFVVDTTYFGQPLAGKGNFDIDNVVELHFGTEYVLNVIENVPVALRAGLYHDPAHDLEYSGPSATQQQLFDGGEDVWHYTVGTGVVLFDHYQIDVGADITEDSQDITVSMVYQF